MTFVIGIAVSHTGLLHQIFTAEDAEGRRG